MAEMISIMSGQAAPSWSPRECRSLAAHSSCLARTSHCLTLHSSDSGSSSRRSRAWGYQHGIYHGCLYNDNLRAWNILVLFYERGFQNIHVINKKRKPRLRKTVCGCEQHTKCCSKWSLNPLHSVESGQVMVYTTFVKSNIILKKKI